jgi:hypothetical protein
MRITRVLFLKTKPICHPNFHNENCYDRKPYPSDAKADFASLALLAQRIRQDGFNRWLITNDASYPKLFRTYPQLLQEVGDIVVI